MLKKKKMVSVTFHIRKKEFKGRYMGWLKLCNENMCFIHSWLFSGHSVKIKNKLYDHTNKQEIYTKFKKELCYV